MNTYASWTGALTDKPRRDKLGVSVDRYPRPHVSHIQ